MKRIAILLLLLWPALATTQAPPEPPRLTLQPKPVADHDGLHVEGQYTLVVTALPFKVVGPAGADDYDWTFPATWTATADEQVLTVTAATEGTAVVRLKSILIDFGAKKFVKKTYTLSVTVGKGPAPPQPPGPGPGPGPGPQPPGPAPIPAAGLHVLIVFETADLAKMPPEQLAVLTGKQVHDYLDQHCPVGPDGKTREWRIWDQNVDPRAESLLWQTAFKRPRGSVPWLVVSNPDKGGGYEGKLPATVAETMAILKQWGE